MKKLTRAAALITVILSFWMLAAVAQPFRRRRRQRKNSETPDIRSAFTTAMIRFPLTWSR